MWASYNSLRTSDEYQQMWEMFLLNSVKAPIFCPMFCQYMGHHLFRHLVLSQTSVQRCTSQLLTTELTYEQLNGLRYAAGYVPRALMKKISRSKDSNRTDILQWYRRFIKNFSSIAKPLHRLTEKNTTLNSTGA